MLVPARGSSSWRSVSTQGPVALTTARVRIVSSSPAAVRTSTPAMLAVVHVEADDLAARRDRRAAGGRRAGDRDTRRASSVWWSW